MRDSGGFGWMRWGVPALLILLGAILLALIGIAVGVVAGWIPWV
ncbi:MAG: hypothetical protein RQ891_12075 [Thermoflexus sp.]|jgi:hypothetical protein|nr:MULTISPECIES: hypothetical protein [Thermoflexus]MDT7885577.1 hypothetical protein [Thermoflexus sp.]MDT7949691.1 hypothetical protein [Thermoflexus sp.]